MKPSSSFARQKLTKPLHEERGCSQVKAFPVLCLQARIDALPTASDHHNTRIRGVLVRQGKRLCVVLNGCSCGVVQLLEHLCTNCLMCLMLHNIDWSKSNVKPNTQLWLQTRSKSHGCSKSDANLKLLE